MKKALTIAALALLLASHAYAQATNEFQIERTATPPKMDGILDDEVWTRAPLPLGEWVSYNPVRGDKMSSDLRTEVRIAYDDRNIYFAFHCFDNEPDKLRTNVSKRDSSFSDDWIAMSLDSAGTGQSAYHLFSNPSGSQMDALNTSASGEQFDADMVWYSVAKTTKDGYVVEVQLPLQTLRFSGGDQVRMGLVFFRKISRIGVSYAWPEMLPGQWVFDRPAHLLFSNLKPRRLVELLPSVTYGVTQARATATQWEGADGDPNVGLNGKFGITSGITLDGTINPDFSQVESDAFQVEVNQRFPVFYSEKRPFFMEGMGLFNIAGTGGDGNMRTAVHTRRIVNPMWGSKVTGTAGKTTFGVLNAYDERPEEERNKLFTIGRATYALRRSDYLGAIVTDTEQNGRRNLVAGGDLSIRLSPSQQISATALTTRTDDPVEGDTSGASAQATYGYETRRINFATQVEHYDRDFQMDTAFYNRTGFTAGWSFGEISFYPKDSWLQRIHPFYFTKIGHDDVQDGSEAFLNTGLRFNFTRQGFLNLSYATGHEAWRGQEYQVGNDFNMFGEVQAFRWLQVYTSFGVGPAIYYDEVNPFQGRSQYLSGGVTIQPNQHITQNLEVNTVQFDRASTKERIYEVTIVNSKTTYQFDKHFLIRFLAQYDSSANRVLTDLLASYEFVPGTVFHAGYGSISEKRLGPEDRLVPVDLGEKYLTVNRGLFFKASYLRRF
jgi:Domain of unknown function (DUF5916)/Carbohydrate family 9 binding domain-like